MEKTTKKKERNLKFKWLKLTSSLHQEGSGDRELFNALVLLAIGLFNLFNFFTDKEASEGLLFAVILVSLAVAIYILPFREIIIAYIFLILALLVHKDMTDPYGFSSAALFILAYSNRRKKAFGVIVLALTVSSIVYRSTLFNDNPSQVLMTIILYVFLYTNFWKIFKKEENNAKIENGIYTKVCFGSNSHEISHINVEIMQMRCLGYEWHKINDILQMNVTDQTICTRISRLRKKLGFRSQEEFVFWLMSDTCKNSRINDNCDDSDNKYDMINQFDS